MKRLFLLSLCLCGAAAVFGQQYKIIIKYDANGNRIIRERVTKSPETPASFPSNALDSLLADNEMQTETNENWGNRDLEVKVFPNPSEGTFTVELNDAGLLKQTCTIVVTDALGRQILHQSISGLRSTFDLSRATDGFYTCTVVSGNFRKTVRLVKQTR